MQLEDTAANAVEAAAAQPGEKRRDMVAFALDALRTMIVRGELAPGAVLSQVQLARTIGVSTTPLREAIRQLEAEGLIESRPNRRARVPPFDVEDLEAVYGARILMEALATATAVPRMRASDLAELERHLDVMRRAAKDRDIAAWHAAHGAFHAGLVARCNPALRQQVTVLAARSDRYRLLSVLSDQPASWAVGDADHAAILEACKEGDATLASQRLAENLGRSALILVAHLAPGADPVGVRVALQMVLRQPGIEAPAI